MQISEADAAQIDQVLSRPEFAGWGRDEWCLEIIRTALRYYARRGPAAERGPERARPAAGAPEPAAAGPEPETPARERPPAARERPPAGRERPPAAPEPPADQPRCSHPADARDYETGSCAACGAILWD